uniref:Uncharacterized protein n=1 Tax=Desulfomonile tiedjei TaxID=2358 RepID=A0A7C4AQJ9_9BACT
MKITAIALALVMACSMVFAQNKIIRDRYNNDVEIWRQSGSRTDVYDAQTNQLLRTRYRDGDRTIIRTPNNEEESVEYDQER